MKVMSATTSRLRRSVLISVLLVILLFLLAINAKQWYRRSQQRSEMNELKAEIARLESQERTMREFLEDIRSPLYIEREGRQRLGYKKAGETAVIFPSTKTGKDSGAEETDMERRQGPPYVDDWFAYFFPRE